MSFQKTRFQTKAEQAQLAMVLEVTAYPKPGNVDRCHDYEGTKLEHFLASIIFARPALDEVLYSGYSIGEQLYRLVKTTHRHNGGNTHFGAFLLLVPLMRTSDLKEAYYLVRNTTVKDAVFFYKAFGLTEVRILPSDSIDVNDPGAVEAIEREGLTLFDIMQHSKENDMIAREWVNGFPLTGRARDLILSSGTGRCAITSAFISLLALEPDTFIQKKHGKDTAYEVLKKANEVIKGVYSIEDFDEWCICKHINPGSTADLIIAGIYLALGEGWNWEF